MNVIESSFKFTKSRDEFISGYAVILKFDR